MRLGGCGKGKEGEKQGVREGEGGGEGEDERVREMTGVFGRAGVDVCMHTSCMQA